MKRQTLLGLLASLALAVVPFIAAKPALADTVNGVTCDSYHSRFPNGNDSLWPNDWATSAGHIFVCSPSINSAQALKVLQVSQGRPSNQKTLFASKGLTYFIFATRANANSYMSGKSPYSSTPAFQSTTARCGNTAYNAGTGDLAVEIYATCQLASGPVANPNLYNVTMHEQGHAFDFALALNSSHPGVPFSRSLAFKRLFNSSTNLPTAGSDTWALDNTVNWRVKPPTCTLFGSATTPPLEHDLGLPNSVNSPVCVNGVVQAPFTGLLNFQIAQKQDAYFNLPAGSAQDIDIFAQLYAAQSGGESPDPLAFLDSYILQYRCTARVLTYLIGSLTLPPDSQLSNLSCWVPAASDWTHF